MIRILIASAFITLGTFTVATAQGTGSSTTVRPRTANTNQGPETKPPTDKTKPAAAQNKPAAATPQPSGSTEVVATFNKLLEGIRHADLNAVTDVYWKSPSLVLFNNNGTVTRGWEQMRKNRESSYPELKDVKLECRDVSVMMLGRDGAVVNCLWTQSQTFKGTPETASGRMTLVFKRVGKDWKAVHLHTSPDKQDPSRILPSEEATPMPTPKP